MLGRFFRTRSSAPDPRLMDTDALIRFRQAYTMRRLQLSAGLALSVGSITAVAGILSVLMFLSQMQVDHVLRIEGVLQAVSQAQPVSHPTGGVVRQVLVTEGEVVREGQLLMSLDASDLKERHEGTQKRVAGLMLQSLCLRAERDFQDSLSVPPPLRVAIGRLGQTVEMERGVRSCNAVLKRKALQRHGTENHLRSLQDQITLHEQLSRSQTSLRGMMRQFSNDVVAKNIEKMARAQLLLKSVENRISLRGLENQLAQARNDEEQSLIARQQDIQRELDQITDDLAHAEKELADMDARADARFLYASATGRIQRLRVSKSGLRIAGGAHVLEIAPLDTDFEVRAAVPVSNLRFLDQGQLVSIQLSAGLPRPVQVPARIDQIRPATENTRTVTFALEREELNRRDLLIGERSLNGLGEQSEALISVEAKSAIRSLAEILASGLRHQEI